MSEESHNVDELVSEPKLIKVEYIENKSNRTFVSLIMCLCQESSLIYTPLFCIQVFLYVLKRRFKYFEGECLHPPNRNTVGKR